jgi:hypothetical protein
MAHFAMAMFGPETEVFGNLGLWGFLAVGAVALFGVFLPITTWMDHQRKEREAFYKAESFRRMTEAPGDNAKAAIEMMHAQNRIAQIKQREGMKLGGLITVAVGAGLCIFLRVVAGGAPGSPWLVGLIPGFVGIAMLIYVFFLAEPIQ